MDLKDLSSNWKKLQKTLQSTSRPLKRKASEGLHRGQHNGVKRRKSRGHAAGAIQPVQRYQKRKIMEDETVTEVPIALTNTTGKVNEGLSAAYALPSPI